MALLFFFLWEGVGEMRVELMVYIVTGFSPLSSLIIFGLKTLSFGTELTLPGPVFTNHSQEHSLSLSPRFANLNVTQLLIG